MTALKSKKVLLLAVVATMAGLVTGNSIDAATSQYEYDDVGRMTKVTFDDGTSVAYKYDAAGNLLNVSSGEPGDVNNDGGVNAVDVQLVINAALGIETDFNSDINTDGSVNAVDVQLVINGALGIPINVK